MTQREGGRVHVCRTNLSHLQQAGPCSQPISWKLPSISRINCGALHAFPGKNEGWDFTLVLGWKTCLSFVLLKAHIKASSYHICTWKAPDVIPSWCPPLWNDVELGLAVSWCDSAASSRWLPWLTQEPFCSQSCDGAVAWELLVSHTWLQVTNGPFLLQRVQMFLLRLFLQIRMGGLDASWKDWLASAFQALLLPGEIWCWVSKVSKISINFPIVLSSCVGSEVEVCKQRGWKRSISKLATNSLFSES